MFKIEFDYAELSKAAMGLNAAADQIPYATALALNRSADVTRNYLIRATWPGHIQSRNHSFIAASLTTKEARATKSMLSVEIYDKLNRGNLMLHAKGGTRTPKGGGNLAVPVSSIKRTSRGVPSRLRPRNLKVAVKKNGMLYSKDTKGRLKLLYALKPTTKVPKRVPFYEDFNASMAREMNRTLPLAIKKAMETRRR